MAQAQSPGGDGLTRWLVGGFVAGLIVLGLMIAAYAVGYDRGKSHGKRTAARPTTTTPKPLPPPPPTTTAAKPTQSPAKLAALGRQLYMSDGCSGCHSLDGSAGAGPTFKGLAGSTVTLTDGSTATADDAYLARAITDPDAQISKGYRSGIMSSAVSGFGLKDKPADLQALVAFIKAQRG
jgi:mono/diheme cytochrome c family protein